MEIFLFEFFYRNASKTVYTILVFNLISHSLLHSLVRYQVEHKRRDSISTSSPQIRPLLWSFPCFWSSFIEIDVLNEKEYTILCILYCYSLQQHIFLVLCIDITIHYRLLVYIPPRNIFFIRPILRFSLVVNMEECKFKNFENSYKINENSYDDNFFIAVIRRKRKFRKFMLAKKNGGLVEH